MQGKKVVQGKEKPKEEKVRPSDDELREAICEILKEVDFNTVRIRYFCMMSLKLIILYFARNPPLLLRTSLDMQTCN